MNTEIIDARTVWSYTKEVIWKYEPISEVALRFDNDAVVVSNGRSVIFSWYLGVFHRAYPETPLLPVHHLGQRPIEKDIELRILEKGLFDCIEHYGERVDREKLALMAYEAQNVLYNDMSSGLKRYVSTTSILEFLEIMDHPVIHETNRAVQAQEIDIPSCYATVWETLVGDPVFKNNSIAQVSKTGLVSKDQVLQCIGPRGVITDIDSTVLKKPLLTGFVEGHHTLADALAESRAAAKSLILSSASISDSEFFSRELQFNCSTIARIHPGDCGSKATLPFFVHDNDLKHIAGKHYLLENGQWGVVCRADTHLIGRTVFLRTALKCQHSDRYGVCEVCFGTLSKSIPQQTNIGFLSAILLCEQVSQNLLSAKHIQVSCDVSSLDIRDEDVRFIDTLTQKQPSKTTNVYTDDRITVVVFKPWLKERNPMLRLASDQIGNLSEIDYYPIEKLTPSMITRLDSVGLSFRDQKTEFEQTVSIVVSNKNQYSWMTSEALAYVKRKGWVLTDRGEALIDLSEWDFTSAFFQLPMKHVSAMEFMNTVKAFIKNNNSRSKNKLIKPLSGYSDVDRAVVELYELINSTLNVNLSYLEIIVLAMMAARPDERDFRPPRPIEEGQITDYTNSVNHRSLGVSMAYNQQYNRLTRHLSFLVKERPDSIFDNLLVPLADNPRD